MIQDVKRAIAIDAGVSQVRGALITVEFGQVSLDAEVTDWTRLGETPNVNATCALMHKVAQAVLDKADPKLEWTDIGGVGVAVPNPVDRDGFVEGTTWKNWHYVDLRGLLQQTFRGAIRQSRIIVLNDANSAALGEAVFGRGKEETGTDLVHFIVTRGVAAGIVLDGALRYGENGAAGEWGHVVIEPDGQFCWSCRRQNGCLETVASGQAMANAAANTIKDGGGQRIYEIAYTRDEEQRKGATQFGDSGGSANVSVRIGGMGGERRELTIWARDVAQAASEDDADALKIVAEAGEGLGKSIVQALHILNPKMVTIGGFIVELCPDPYREAARKWMFDHALKSAFREPMLAKLGDRGALYGCAAAVFRSLDAETRAREAASADVRATPSQRT